MNSGELPFSSGDAPDTSIADGLLHRTMEFSVRENSLRQCKRIIAEFIAHVRKNESGTVFYLSLEDAQNPTRFLHIMAFRDTHALETHVSSLAHKFFLSELAPELEGSVHTSDFTLFDGRYPAPATGKARWLLAHQLLCACSCCSASRSHAFKIIWKYDTHAAICLGMNYGRPYFNEL